MANIYVTAIVSEGNGRYAYSVMSVHTSEDAALCALGKHLTTRMSTVFLRYGSTGKRLSVAELEDTKLAHIPWHAKKAEWKRLAEAA